MSDCWLNFKMSFKTASLLKGTVVIKCHISTYRMRTLSDEPGIHWKPLEVLLEAFKKILRVSGVYLKEACFFFFFLFSFTLQLFVIPGAEPRSEIKAAPLISVCLMMYVHVATAFVVLHFFFFFLRRHGDKELADGNIDDYVFIMWWIQTWALSPLSPVHIIRSVRAFYTGA